MMSNWGRFFLRHFYVKFVAFKNINIKVKFLLFLLIIEFYIKMSQKETSPIGHWLNRIKRKNIYKIYLTNIQTYNINEDIRAKYQKDKGFANLRGGELGRWVQKKF